MAKKRISQSERKKQKVDKSGPVIKTEYGGFIDGKSFVIKPSDPEYEFIKGFWEVFEKDNPSSSN